MHKHGEMHGACACVCVGVRRGVRRRSCASTRVCVGRSVCGSMRKRYVCVGVRIRVRRRKGASTRMCVGRRMCACTHGASMRATCAHQWASGWANAWGMRTCVDVVTCVDEVARRREFIGKWAWAKAVAATGAGPCALVRCSFFPRTLPELKEKHCF